MKVRIAVTLDVSDDFRCALRERYGKAGMATRTELKQWYRSQMTANDDDILDMYNEWLAAQGRD